MLIRSIGLQCATFVPASCDGCNRDDIRPIFVLLETSRQKDFLPYVFVPNSGKNIYEKHQIVKMNSPRFHRHILFDQRLVHTKHSVYETARGN